MLEHIGVETKTIDGKLFMSVDGFAQHLKASSVQMMMDGIARITSGEATRDEVLAIKGLLIGMDTLIFLLSSSTEVDKFIADVLK